MTVYQGLERLGLTAHLLEPSTCENPAQAELERGTRQRCSAGDCGLNTPPGRVRRLAGTGSFDSVRLTPHYAQDDSLSRVRAAGINSAFVGAEHLRKSRPSGA